MRCTVDVGELALDTEPAVVDLTRDGLGDRCLDAAMAGMLASHGAQRAPDGTPWPPLSAATVRRKDCRPILRLKPQPILQPPLLQAIRPAGDFLGRDHARLAYARSLGTPHRQPSHLRASPISGHVSSSTDGVTLGKAGWV